MEATPPTSSLARELTGPRTAGAFTTVIGALVAIGWIAHVPALVQLRTHYAPVQPNAALAFVAIGLALVLHPVRPRLAAALAAGTAALAGLTLVQDLVGVEAGIDRLAFDPWVQVRTAVPGRMPPQCAVSFLAASAAVVLLGAVPLASWFLGAVVLALGSVVLAGYGSGVRAAVTWGNGTDVAAISALAFVVLGAGLVTAAASRARAGTMPSSWIPWATALTCVLASVIYWQALSRQQHANVRRSVRQTAIAAENAITSRVEAQAIALQDAALRYRGPRSQGWKSAGRRVLRLVGGPAALEWVAPDLSVQSRAMHPHRLKAPPGVLDATQALAFEEARAFGRVTVTPPFALGEGRTGFRIVVPVITRRRLDGFLTAVYPADGFFAAPLEELPGTEIAVTVGTTPLYATNPVHPAGDGPWDVGRTVDLPGNARWHLAIGPTDDQLATLDSPLPEVLLAAGLLIAFLFFAMLRAWGDASRRVQELAQTNALLDAEVTAHQRELKNRIRAEDELRALTRELDQMVQERTAELASVSGTLVTESARRQRAQATVARSTADLKQFASFVSHELRQPLGSMQIWVKLLGKTYAEALDERGHKYLMEIRDAIGRMTGFVEAQLRLVHDTTSDTDTDELVDLGAVLGELVADLEPQLDQIRATVTVADVPVVQGDASQLRQLFRNLLENAVKYRRPEVPLVVAIRGRLVESANGGDAACEIRVADNGRGFEPELAEQIFRMFRRAHQDGSPGAGVGLAICRRIVEHHGGTIHAEGRPDDGATFVVILPFERCEARSEGPATPASV